jgi:hypothetical protein
LWSAAHLSPLSFVFVSLAPKKKKAALKAPQSKTKRKGRRAEARRPSVMPSNYVLIRGSLAE